MKILKTTIILSLTFLALLGIFYSIGKKYSYSQIAVDLLFKAINSKINGKLVAEKPILRLKGRLLNAYAESIELFDESNNVIFSAKQADIIWSLTNLINPGQNFKKIKAEKVTIDAFRDEDGVWNYSNLLKTKTKKKFEYKIASLNLPDIDLNITDELIDSNISFQKMSLLYQDKKRKKVFKLRSDQSIMDTEISGISSRDIADLSNSDLSNLIDIDSVVIAGGIIKDAEERYKVRIINLDPINIRFLMSLIDFGDHPDLKTALNKYTETTKLTVVADLEPDSESKESTAKLKIVLNNLVDIPELKLTSDLNLSEDLKINNLNISFANTDISLNGEIEKWKTKNPSIDLSSKVVNLNIKKLKKSFIELDKFVPDFFLDMLSSIGVGDYLQGDIKIGSSLQSPLVTLSLPIGSSDMDEKQSITAIAEYLPDRIKINEASIPMGFSALKLTGYYLLDESDYDLNLEAEDLPVLRLRNLFVHLPILRHYQSYLISPILSGYTSFGLEIKPKFIQGNIKIAKADYFTNEFPVEFEDLNADIDINNTKLIINSLSSKLDGNYIEARAGVNLNQDSSKLTYEAEIASPLMNVAVINRSGLLKLSKQTEPISNLSGFVSDFYLDIKKTDLLSFNGKADLDGISFRYKDQYDFKNVRGALIANKQGYKFEKCSFNFNDGFVGLSGSSDLSFIKPHLKLETKNLDFKEFMNLINAEGKFGIIANKGFLDSELNLNGSQLIAKGSLQNADFIVKKFEKLKYPFLNITTDFEISKDLNFTNLSGKYGSSSFINSALALKNYKTEDLSFDLVFNGNLVIAELESLIPESISKFLTTKGALPIDLKAFGNTKKSIYDVSAEANKMESFQFSNWLEIDKNYSVIAKTKFIVTPQLIFSETARIISSRNNSKTELDASFQIQDWKEKDNATVSFNTSTLNGGTMKANLGLIGPHIISLKPLNLELGIGTMDCGTRSDDAYRQTACLFFVDDAIARKYGIGDLKAKDIRVDLLSVTDAPLDVQVRLKDGDWNGIDYKKVKFDLKVFDDHLDLNNLKANLPDSGSVRGNTSFNFNTLESEFFLRGNRVSANQLVDGVWGFGVEVPEGRVSGIFKGKTKGLLPDEMFFNMVANTELIVRDGKLSSLKTMQKILSAVNTLKNFDFNNVFQTLITYKGGLFNYVISSLQYDHGRVSSEKVLLKADEIELNLTGFLDFSKDQLSIDGEGLIPKRSNSILRTVGVGPANLGNLLSIANLGHKGIESKNLFKFNIMGPISDVDKTVESVKSSFQWIEL